MRVIQGYCFDDVLLIPKRSSLASRNDVDISTTLGGLKLKIPIVSANMKTVTGPALAKAIADLGGLAILHRFCSLKEQLENFKDVICGRMVHRRDFVGVSVGIQNDDFNNVAHFIEIGAKIICVDVAHGHHDMCLAMVASIKNSFKDTIVIAGNVATLVGARDLYNAGADVIKIGVGPGSLCSTRIETGNGVPQLTALAEIYEESRLPTIADGGIKAAGDIVKCLCFSNAVMLGNLLAGTDEAPGEIVTVDGLRYKTYVGSSTHKTNHIEGVAGLVPCRGPVSNVINKLLEGLRSGMSYQGAATLQQLRKDPKFVSISHAGLVESRPHDVLVK